MAHPHESSIDRVPRRLYFGGGWHDGHGGRVALHSPGDGRPLGAVDHASAADVDLAVEAAEAAFADWRDSTPLARATLLRRIAAVLRENAPELAWLDSLNGGNPIAEMLADVETAARHLDYFGGLAGEIRGETHPGDPRHFHYSLREPYGVVARIVAYNHPLMFTAAKIAPALAAGNAVIMKPPVQAPLSALRLAELLHGVVPPGLVSFLPGDVECGRALAAHGRIRRISLIGSVATGKAVATEAAAQLKHVTLELGGKNACIIAPDADLPDAIAGAVRGMNFTWAGQSCGSTSRCLVHESVHDEVLAGIVEGVKAYVPGLPTDPATTMGALISRAHLDRVRSHVDRGLAEGARLVAGGTAPDDLALRHGHYFQPTVFADVTPAMHLAREEVFGPVLSVMRWRTEADLVRWANEVDHGLTAAIWTRDLDTAHRLARRMEVGYVWINGTGQHFLGTSFGGWKHSGIGREESMEELLSYTQSKTVTVFARTPRP